MTLHFIYQEQSLPISLEEAWEFFSTPRNLNEITPPGIGFEMTHDPGGPLREGKIIAYRIHIMPLVQVSWITEIKAVDEGKSFIDEQRFGPYKFWHHRHAMEPVPGGVKMRDEVYYGLPFGPLGAVAHKLFVRRKLEYIFRCRREILEQRFGKMA